MYSFAAVSKVLPEARCSSFSVAHAAASASHFLLPLGDGSSQVKDLYIRFPDGSLCEKTRQRQDPDWSFLAAAILLPPVKHAALSATTGRAVFCLGANIFFKIFSAIL